MYPILVRLLSVLVSLMFAVGVSPPALAIPIAKEAIAVQVHLGTDTGELKFVPDRLEFEAGKRYKLLLDNPSPQKHYFTAKDFADAIWSQKVDAGNVEIKGAIHELELRPGSQAAWVFIPLKAGTYTLRCSIPGHSEAGMVGTLAIANEIPSGRSLK